MFATPSLDKHASQDIAIMQTYIDSYISKCPAVTMKVMIAILFAILNKRIQKKLSHI